MLVRHGHYNVGNPGKEVKDENGCHKILKWQGFIPSASFSFIGLVRIKWLEVAIINFKNGLAGKRH